MEISDRSLKKIRWQKMLNTLRKWLLILPRNGFENESLTRTRNFHPKKPYIFKSSQATHLNNELLVANGQNQIEYLIKNSNKRVYCV